ncbi:uncharacterized protein Dwil_GK13220 [Drosophila willistoni]|uniref:Methionine synthase reductase n=1 Tax=Drosophila willistoni TaxID=7260 RepID=B4NL98_DROWI|nr:methionine synthase reductase isoform X2 [Drosophila willistoni]EDW84301.1 uncharacterized protein Dwil_GK13220 [Drosophila willistoni]
MVASTSPLNVDIGDYILNDCVPAKRLELNLEICYDSTEKITTCAQPAQMRFANVKYPFARIGAAPTSVAITNSQVVVKADPQTDTKHVVELTLQLDPDAAFSYEPGDTIAILPHNENKVVDALLQRLHLSGQADDVCHIKLASKLVKKSAKLPEHIPNSSSVREIFTHCLSLNGILKKQFLSSLAEYTTDERERGFLNSLSSKQGTSFYNELILERGLGFLDLMQICGICQPSLALLVEHLPRLLPRPYSIANSPSCEGGLKIIYSILPVNPGVATSMLESKSQQRESKIFIYPRLSNAFRYTTEDLNKNQILIAIGTGLAPFLGFLEHKEFHNRQANVGKTWLYVGARTAQAVLKRDQLLAWQESSSPLVLQRLRMCYSRGDSPTYVQQLLEEDAEELVELILEPETVLYVCADGAKISQSIGQALSKCLQKVLHLDETQSAERLKELRQQGKYREDIWL